MCSYDAASRTTRANPPGTYAQTWRHSTVTCSRLLIAQAGRSRLALYDLLTHELTYLPSNINWTGADPTSTALEDPVRSDRPRTAAVLRYEIRIADLTLYTVRLLARLDGHAEYPRLGATGQPGSACPESTCNVWRENLRSGTCDRRT